jgi:hypothetical protein
MKEKRSGDKEVLSAIKFLQRTQNGEYCRIDVDSLKGKRIDVPVIFTDEEIYYYSISN